MRQTTSKKIKTRNWIASVALNTATETQNFISSNNLIQLPIHFRIFLSEVGDQNSTPQYEFIRNSGFRFGWKAAVITWATSNINSLTTSKVTINVAQQLGLHYLFQINEASNVGSNMVEYYSNSLNYVTSLINNNYWPPEYGPFGNGLANPVQGYYSDAVAMWQAFAQHLGHTVADRVFGWGEYNFDLQGKTWSSGGGISSSVKYLENFDPSIGQPYDYFNWIPVGLINDLIDNNPDPFPVVDNV